MGSLIINMIKNSRLIKEIWEILDSINNKLEEHGILKDVIEHESYSFRINFDITKMNNNSLVKKYDLSGILLSCPPDNFFSPEISLLKDDIILDTIKINSIFPTTNILKEICKIIGIKFFNTKGYDILFENYYYEYNDEYDPETCYDIINIINNLKHDKNYDIYKSNLEFLNAQIKLFKRNNKNKSKLLNIFKIYKDEFETLDETKMKSEIDKSILNTYEKHLKKRGEDIKNNFNETINMNDRLHFQFILSTIFFEIILFPEIFNFESKHPMHDDKHINIYKKKYIQLLAIIHKIYDTNIVEYLKSQKMIVSYVVNRI